MKSVVLYSPGLSSMNLGDKIISESAKENLSFVLNNSFQVEISSHLPQSYYYMRHLKDADYKFVLGSNLLKSTFFGFKRQWDITLRLSKITGPCILVGAGWWQYNNKPNLYTKILLKSILSKDYIHSVRDEYTLKMLKSIGIDNVINTSCPTMWKLNKDHCSLIKNEKAKEVVFTITDYKKDNEKDSYLINILTENYQKVYFWPQGLKDLDYFNSLNININKIDIMTPTVEAFTNLFKTRDVEYVGTRLHGGIRALQNKRRTLIIGVDNRALEKKKSFNLPVLMRDDIDKLNDIINSTFSTKINIPEDNINRWLKQFDV